MYTILVLDGDKLRAARGNRTLREIVEASGNRFSEQLLSAWEKGKYQPRATTMPYLLKALGVTVEQITRTVDLIAA